MPLTNFPDRFIRYCLTFIFTMLATAFAYAAPAGHVDFTHGTVSATDTDGSTRALIKGAQVNTGDVINTAADGRVQIRFADGSYLSLQPNTLFRIDNFAFNGKSDGSEKAFFSLVKGGLRKITGVIGKANRQNYEMATPSATIGIRGTTYSALQDDNGLTVTVGEGMVSVGNQQGNLTLSAGQSAFVASRQTSPVMSNEKVLLPRLETPQQEQLNNRVALNETLNDKGLPVLAPPITRPAPSENSPVLTTGNGYTIAYAASLNSIHGKQNAAATFDAGGTLLNFDSAGFKISFDGQARESGSDSLIGWGRWIGSVSGNIDGAGTTYAPNEGFHYVVGLPTPTANLSGMTGNITYSMIGHTLPTTSDGSSSYLGSVDHVNGKVSVSFGANPTMTMNFKINSNTPTSHIYDMSKVGPVSLVMGGDKATFSASTGGGSACRAYCSVELNGLFSGSSAERLGFVYQINDSAYITKGAVAFKR